MKRATLAYDSEMAVRLVEDRHPQVVIREIAHRYGLTVIGAHYDERADAWAFEIESPTNFMPPFPDFITTRMHR